MNVELHLALAVYLATYANSNKSTKEYYDCCKDEALERFIRTVLGEDQGYDADFREQMACGLDVYRATMRRIVNGDTRLQVRMLSIRKFFSIPWLVCPDRLLESLD